MRVRRTRWAALAASTLVATSFAAVAPSMATAQDAAEAAAPVAASSAAPTPLGQKAVAIARDHLRANSAEFGLSGADVDELTVSSVVPNPGNGLTNVWLQQRVKSISVANAMLNVAVRADGSVLRVASSAVASASKKVNASSPTIGDVQAAQNAAAVLGLTPTGSFESGADASGASRSRTLDPAGISRDPIPSQLVFEPTKDGGLALAWQLVINQLDGEHWWQISIDATTGKELDTVDWVDEDSHNVFPFPVESPSFGSRSVLTNPSVAAASPFGWNDTNGVAGAESTLTQGNNVRAYTDTDNDNAPDAGGQPDGGASLAFNFPLDLTQPPSAYRPAAVSNLYYANNRIHDVMYRYGFNEQSANFQVNNYGKGRTGNDAVNAEAQDGGGTNNANFATPPEGTAPRMQMYLWNQTSPSVDGDLDNGIIVHEYGHGISNRLTGGGTNVSCLGNQEQGGEGWSDYFALFMTQAQATEQAGGRGIGTYALGQPVTGAGIRTQKYSTNFAINNHTYDDIKTMVAPHGVGEVWATMLWDLNWAMVGQYGWSPDQVNGNGGNNKTLQLVIDGLKLQPCSPGFVDARDAILAADQADYAGANKCLIWQTFARRGLGFSATQGSSNSQSDGVEAFDLPPACSGVEVTATATPSPVAAGQQLTYSYLVENTSGATVTGISLASVVGDNATYVPGSATCAGTYDSATTTVTFPVGSRPAGTSRTCQMKVQIANSPFSTIKLEDDFEPDLSSWTATHGSGSGDWTLSTAQAKSPTHSAFTTGPSSIADQYLTLNDPVTVSSGDYLSFWHQYGFESTFDGGVVEVSTDGGTTWNGVDPAAFTENGYNTTISSGFSSPIAGRRAFSGTAATFAKSTIDLTAYVGTNIKVRFRSASDTSVASPGWYVDDVTIGRVVQTVNTVRTTATGFPSQEQDVATTIVAPGPATAPPAPSVTSSTASPGAVQVAFSPNGTGGSAITGYTAQCQSTDGGVAKAANGTASPITVSGLTAGKSYRCRVRATNAVGTGAYSAFGATVALPPPTTPAAPTVTGSTPLSGAVKVTFTAGGDGGSPITAYAAQCVSSDGGVTKVANGGASPITVTGLTGSKTYRCRVRAANAVGSSAYGAYGSTVVLPAPVAPSAPTVTASVGQPGAVKVTFSPSSDGGSPVTGFTVQCVSTDGGVTRALGGTASPITVTGLSAGKSYHCRVRATNAVGSSTYGPYGATVVVS